MAKKEISIVLRAKNELQVGLAKAGHALKSFGSSVLNIGKWIAGAFLAGGTAIAGFAAKALSAYAVQEAAVNQLSTALRAYGEEVEVNTDRIKKLASAIQDETGVSDESLIARAAKLKMLGVETDALGDALKATVALAAIGMEEEASVKAIAMAREGNYTMLQRYIPALRTATSETEKAALLNDFLSKSYEVQKGKLDTLSGQWGLFKNRVGDVWEEVGAIISNNGAITAGLAAVNEKIKAVGESIKEWASGGGVETAIATVQYFGAEAVRSFSLVYNSIKLYIAVLWDTAAPIRYLINLNVQLANAVAGFIDYSIKGFAALGKAIMNPFAGFKPPDAGPMIESFKRIGQAAVDTEGFRMAATKAAAEERRKIESDYATKITDIQQRQMDALAKANERRVANEATSLRASVANNAAAANAIEGIVVAGTRKLEAVADNKIAIENTAMDDIVDANRDAVENISDLWRAGADQFAEIESGKVKTAQKAASEMSRLTGEKMPAGGTFESSSDFIKAKLKAAGIDPNTPGGSRLSGVQASNLAGVTSEQILAELKNMNKNQERLLTLG